jgi:hypothetical protein
VLFTPLLGVVVAMTAPPAAASLPTLGDLGRSGHNPRFIEILNRSWARYERDGGIPAEEMRRRHLPVRRASRRHTAR